MSEQNASPHDDSGPPFEGRVDSITDGETRGQADLGRLAGLVANGRITIPEGLPVAKRRKLLKEVAAIRRARLVNHIASAIAIEIHRSRQSDKGD
jgi:hypothetical protein